MKKRVLSAHILCFILIALCTALLFGCASAALTGAGVVYDRHALQKKLDDNYTSMKAYNKIYMDTRRYQNTNISVATFNGAVLLTGQIPDPNHKKEVEHIVRQLAGARKIYNYIEIASPSSPLIHASDSWITTKIKAQFIANNDLDPSQIKVVTENGTVYLMGILPRNQAEIATQIARTTSGVQNVVKIFSYLVIL